MDRAETLERQVETQASAEAAQSSDPSPTSSQERSGPNRLLYQIRTMPLVSLLLGRNVPARNVINDTNSFFLLKCIMGFHLVILVTLVALSTFTIYHYNVRFYKSQTRPSETLIVCWLLRGIWRTVNSSWSLRYYCAGAETTPNLKLSQTFYNLVSILWIGLAVIFLGVSPKEDLKSVSSKICYFLLWATIASYVVPMLAYTLMCFLLYMTLFIVIYFRHGSIPLASGAMPLTLLRKLKVQKYREVLKALNMSEHAGKLGPEEGVGEKNPTYLDVTSPIAINDPLSDCINNAETLAERICSICILKINDEDKVFLLPCDMRHLFHRDCLRKWFKRSSECPICRSNISEILADKKPEHKGSTEERSRTTEYPERYYQQDPIQELGQYPVHESDYSHSDNGEEQDQQELIEEHKQHYEKFKELFEEHSQCVDDEDGKSISIFNDKANETNTQSVKSSNGDYIVVVDDVAADDEVDNEVDGAGDGVASVDVGVKEVQAEHMVADEPITGEIKSEKINEQLNEPPKDSLTEPRNETTKSRYEAPVKSSKEAPVKSLHEVIKETSSESFKPLSEAPAKSLNEVVSDAVEQSPQQLSEEEKAVQESVCEPDEKLQNTHKQVEKEHEDELEEQGPLEAVIGQEGKEDAAEESLKE